MSAPREPSFLLQIQGPFLRASRYVKYEMLSFCILAATERDLQTDLRHVSCVYSPCTQCLNSSFSPVLLRCDCDRIVSNRGGWSGSFSFRQCAGLRDNTQVRKRWESTNLLHGLFTHLDTILTRARFKDDVKNSTAFYLKEFVVSPEEVTVAAIYDVLTKSG